VAADLFGVSIIHGYGFDVELLYVAQQRRYHIAEIPVNWSHQPGSKFRIIRDGLAMLQELAVIRQNWAKGYYASPSQEQNFHPNTAGRVGLPLQ
jgi:dolichyl-phosphate beta-glucosyltransferase